MVLGYRGVQDGPVSSRKRRGNELWDKEQDELYLEAIKASKSFGVCKSKDFRVLPLGLYCTLMQSKTFP